MNIYTNKTPFSYRTNTTNSKNNSMPHQRHNIQEILIFIHTIHNHNWRDALTIYIHNKTGIKRNILTIKQNNSNHTHNFTRPAIHNTNSNQQQRNMFARHNNRKRNYNHNNRYIKSDDRNHNNPTSTILTIDTNCSRKLY